MFFLPAARTMEIRAAFSAFPESAPKASVHLCAFVCIRGSEQLPNRDDKRRMCVGSTTTNDEKKRSGLMAINAQMMYCIEESDREEELKTK